MKRDILEKLFDPAQIKQRVGSYGNVLDYVERHSVIQRLNDAFDGGWCFEILRHKILEETDEVLVLGKLTADNVVKCQFGSSKISRAKDSGEIIPLADDLNAAGTDSLKKWATMLGVGLYLYNGDKSLHERSSVISKVHETSANYFDETIAVTDMLFDSHILRSFPSQYLALSSRFNIFP
jgi:hypothetical protein